LIIFRKVKWKNLLSTGNHFSEIELDKNINTLIVGVNGSGKSTLLDALCFGLFGKPFRSIPKGNLTNSINGKNCEVEVEFDTNNKSYRVVRTIRPNKFEIYIDGELLNQDAAIRDYQEQLEKFILKMNYKSFTQIVVLGSAAFTPFMQLSNNDRRDIIEDLLDIQIFSVMNKITRERLSNNKDLISEKRHNIQLTQQKYEFEEKRIGDLKQNNEDKIDEYERDISTNETNINNLTEEIETIGLQVDEIQKVVVGRLETEQRVKQLNQLETQIETNLSKYKKDVEFFEHNDDCPTCSQLIENEFKTRQIETLKSKIAGCGNGLTELDTKVTKEQSKLNIISEKQIEIQQLQIKTATNTTSITEINRYIARIKINIEELQNTKTVSDIEERKLGELKTEIQAKETQFKELLNDKEYFEVASALLKDTGIKTKIIKQYLPVINKLVNSYLAKLDFFVNFTLDESFKESIKSRFRDDFTYNNFSQGEKQRIDMALMLTWRAVARLKNSTNTNLLILDETFDSSLDSTGVDELLKILHELDNVNIFVISHKGDILQDKFQNIIKFTKVKNFSRIEKYE
jgi:DNA repair exonuclease SbcCD ATPase subunit